MNVMIPAFIGGFALFGLGTFHRIERDAAKDLRDRLSGPGRRVDVRTRFDFRVLAGHLREVSIEGEKFSTDRLPFYTEPNRSARGSVDRLNLNLHDFRLGALHIESLVASIPGCRYDLNLALYHHKIRLSRCGIGAGSVSIRDVDLERFVLEKFHEIQRVKIRLDGDRIHVEGHGQFIVLDTDFSIDARLTAEDGVKLDLSDASMSFGGVAADPSAEEILLKTLNPIVDLDTDLHLDGAIRIQRIELKAGRMTVSGATTIPVRRETAHWGTGLSLSPVMTGR